ncbi:carbon-nitrogen hydrolase [Aspergillus arachidicola]|uniref:Carbon-nitrogen hydrolase n=1 Tax=Aspergillus arachidicola TaxID=656916 RepID=A0A5N6Y4V4_9EURO|nr:carbon-nitrogen hydrolase [Aspergillus arachidicola]
MSQLDSELLRKPLKVACIQIASGTDKNASTLHIPPRSFANMPSHYRGELLAFHRKMHLFDIDVPGGMSFHESGILSAGNKTTIVDLEEYGKIGPGVCFGMRFAELSTIAARQGAFALVYPSAFSTTTGPLHGELLGRARAVDNQVYTMLCSQSRDPNSSYPAWGYSMVTDPIGQVVAGTDQSEDIVYALLDPKTIKRSRIAIPITYQRRHDVYPDNGKLVQLDK